MRDQVELLRRIFGQMDSADENVRLVAFRKAHEMLSSRGIAFSDVFDRAMEEVRRRPSQASAPAPGGSDGDASPTDPDRGSHLHSRVASRFALRHRGKPIVRGSEPPPEVVGRLRILSDGPEFQGSGWRRLKLSFETDDALYEAFTIFRKDPECLAMLRRSSAEGSPVHF